MRNTGSRTPAALEAIYEGAGSGSVSFSTDNEILLVDEHGVVVPALCHECFVRGMNAWLDMRAAYEQEHGRVGSERQQSKGGGRFDDDDGEDVGSRDSW